MVNPVMRRIFLSFFLAFAPKLCASVVINELHYHPENALEFVEFIELTNLSDQAIDLSGWSFSEGIDHVFSAGSEIPANGYYLLAQDETAYNKKWGSIFTGGTKANAAWDDGSLSNTGETLTLRNANNEIVDQVDYQDGFPWPVTADGTGVSLELQHPSLDNDLAGHWRASVKPTGGRENSVTTENPAPALRQIDHSPKEPTTADTVIIRAKATDDDGVAGVTLEVQTVVPGAYVRLTDDLYQSSWESIAMNDAGMNGDELPDDHIYTATIPAASVQHRHLIRYRITAHDTQGATVTLPYADDPTPNRALFVYDGVPVWKAGTRTFTSDEMTALPVYHLIADGDDVERCQYRSSDENRRFRGTMVYDGKVYDHIEFKIRGEFSTYQSGKNKWKFFFNRGNDFEARDNYGIKYPSGFRVMNFSACASPWVPANRGISGLDESTAFRLHALAGSPTPKTHHLHFRVIDQADEAPAADRYDGDLWGLYLSQEHPDGRLLNRLGLPDGSTYKIEGGNGDLKHQGPFESTYSAFVSQARRSQSTEWWHANMNMPAYYGFRAMNRAVGNIDIREGWNHFFYHHPNGQWFPVPWDLDMTFMPETHWSGTIDAKACLNNAEIAVEYASRCRELLDLLLSDGSAGGGQVGSVVEETAQWLGSRRVWIDVQAISKPNSTTAEVVTAEPHGFTSGDQVSISGASVDGYNGTHVITVVDETTFSYGVSLFLAGNVDASSSQVGKGVIGGSSWAEIDKEMWNEHPRSSGGHKGNFYANPTTQNFQGGTLTRTLTSADFGGFADYVRDFSTDTDPDDFSVGDGDQRGYGYNFVRLESEDGKAPNRPVITSASEASFPADGLSFSSSEFSGGTIFQKQTFVGMQWRLGEIYNATTPNYEANTPWRYEITPVWESGTLNAFAADITIPSKAVRVGHTYRVRARHLNQLGGWSHWSEPIEFVASAPSAQPYEGLVITELMYHPGAVSDAELAAGFRREDFEFIELHNRGNEPIDLTALRFTKGVDFDFDDGAIASLSAGAVALVVANTDAMTLRYGAGLPIAGNYAGNLSNGGERIKLSIGAGTPLIEFIYNDDAEGWPSESDGNGKSLIRVDLGNEADLSAGNSWAVGEVGGSPGSLNSVPEPPKTADSDHDGMDDDAESLAGTNPNDASDVLRIESVFRTSNAIELNWSSVVAKRYAIEYAEQLAGTWQSIGESTASDLTSA